MLALRIAWITVMTLAIFSNGRLASFWLISHYRQNPLYLKLNRFLIWHTFFFFFFNLLKAHCRDAAP